MSNIHHHNYFGFKKSQPFSSSNRWVLLEFSLNWLLATQSTTLLQALVRVALTSTEINDLPIMCKRSHIFVNTAQLEYFEEYNTFCNNIIIFNLFPSAFYKLLFFSFLPNIAADRWCLQKATIMEKYKIEKVTYALLI